MSRSEEMRLGSVPSSHMLKYANENQITRYMGSRAHPHDYSSHEYKVYDRMADHASSKELKTQKSMPVFGRETMRKPVGKFAKADEFWNN